MSVRYATSSSSSSDDDIVDNAWFWVFIGIASVAVIGGIAWGVQRSGGIGFSKWRSNFAGNGDVDGLMGGTNW